MCVTLGEANLSRTILYGAEVVHPSTGEVVHVMGYQNRAENLSDGPNAMILPIPAVPGSMSQANLLNTEKCPRILEDMQKAILDGGAHEGLMSARSLSKSLKVEIFHHGIYTVVLAQDARSIPSALNLVESNRRPSLGHELFDLYSDEWYTNHTILLLCFDSKEARDAMPTLVWYEPANPREIFLPTLDCHTGGVPNLNEMVRLDHTLIVGSDMMHGDGLLSRRVTYSDVLPGEVRPFLVNEVMGANVTGGMAKNGDVFAVVNQLRQGRLDLTRRDPLGAEGWGHRLR
jgi:hypothetical protein